MIENLERGSFHRLGIARAQLKRHAARCRHLQSTIASKTQNARSLPMREAVPLHRELDRLRAELASARSTHAALVKETLRARESYERYVRKYGAAGATSLTTGQPAAS